MCYERRDPKQARACFERDQRKVEYIEREAALNRLCQENCGHDFVEDNCHNCYTASFLTYIPAADVVPVVRCSECVLSGNCTAEDTFRLVAGIENPFCCVGKRKEGEG